MSDLTHDETEILSRIGQGRESAVKEKYLSQETSLKGKEVREIIRHLIMFHGMLIASSPADGFWIAETEEEIREATRSLRHRGISILVRAAKLQRISVEEIFHQSRMEFHNGNQ
jgi:hypothetical protein